MGLICAVFLLLALLPIPGSVLPGVPLHVLFALTWFILFVLEKTSVLHLP